MLREVLRVPGVPTRILLELFEIIARLRAVDVLPFKMAISESLRSMNRRNSSFACGHKSTLGVAYPMRNPRRHICGVDGELPSRIAITIDANAVFPEPVGDL